VDIAILVITCVINLALGLFVLVHDSKAGYARAFAIMSTTICIWIFSNYMTDALSSSLAINVLANKVAYFSGYGIVLSGLIFTYFFPIRRVVRRLEVVGVTVLSIIIMGLSFTSLVAGEVTLSQAGALEFSAGPLIGVYMVGFIGLLFLITRNTLLLSADWEKSRRIQARLVLVAFCVSAIVGLLLNSVIPSLINDWATTRFGPLSTLVLVVMIVYAIARHGLFDVRLAVVRTIAYVLSLSTLGGIYYVVAYGVSTVLIGGQSGGIEQSPLNIALALVLAFFFQPIKRLFDRITNAIFYKDNYDTGEFFARLNRVMTSSTDLHDLLRTSASVIATTLKAEHAFFVVQRQDDHFDIVGTKHHSRLPLVDIRTLDAYAAQMGDRAIVSSLLLATGVQGDIRRLMISHKIELILPLVLTSRRVGYLCLGEQKSSGFTKRDTKVLETVSDELTIAIQNALAIQEIRDLNDTLQQRVNAATKELRTTNTILRQLDSAKDEFVSMASHQLRTPLTSVKGYISMLLEGDAGKISEPQQHLLEEAFNSSERMVRLIGDFLNVSRLQTGKFIIDAQEVDLAKVVAQELDSLSTSAQSRELKFNYTPPAKLPNIMIDEGKVRQVIMNFADNALYYSKSKGRIDVTLAVDGNDIVFKVKDTGIGVPKAEQAHLFTKFYRASNAKQQRPDGTGVGLFLARKVVDAHGGKIIFESTEGKGSTFGFRLPIKR